MSFFFFFGDNKKKVECVWPRRVVWIVVQHTGSPCMLSRESNWQCCCVFTCRPIPLGLHASLSLSFNPFLLMSSHRCCCHFTFLLWSPSLQRTCVNPPDPFFYPPHLPSFTKPRKNLPLFPQMQWVTDCLLVHWNPPAGTSLGQQNHSTRHMTGTLVVSFRFWRPFVWKTPWLVTDRTDM